MPSEDGNDVFGADVADIDTVDVQLRDGWEFNAPTVDDLPNAGQPLPDLDKGYDPLWWVKNLVQRENISALPPSLEIKRKVQQELETIWQLRREEDVRAKVNALNAEIARINRTAVSGPPNHSNSP